MAAKETVLAARELLHTLTPLKTDCGKLCGGACCQGDDATGMLLFPGEDALYENCAFAKVLSADFSLGGTPARLLVCQGHCERENRPLACACSRCSCASRTTAPPSCAWTHAPKPSAR